MSAQSKRIETVGDEQNRARLRRAQAEEAAALKNRALLTRLQAAIYGACSVGLLDKYRAADNKRRMRGEQIKGPAWTRTPYGIRYKPADLDVWLARFASQKQTLLTMRLHAGFTWKEIGEVPGRKPPALRKSYERLKTRLRGRPRPPAFLGGRSRG